MNAFNSANLMCGMMNLLRRSSFLVPRGRKRERESKVSSHCQVYQKALQIRSLSSLRTTLLEFQYHTSYYIRVLSFFS